MLALSELSRASSGNFVSSLNICHKLGEIVLVLGLSNILQRFEDEGLIQHHMFPGLDWR